MKINSGDIHTAVSAGVSEMVFSVDEEDQGFIFEMLRSKIYSDPIAAICREISSNSRDANREVMKGHVPVEIGIREEHPLNGDSSLHIYFKDSGPGISPDRMANVFCKYAKSTKRDDDEQTGGFGLGAKTPFAYTDAFTIITVVDGVEYMYTAYIDESRRGKVGKLNEIKTDAPNGTTISIPIHPKDRNKFELETFKYVSYWDVQPKILNFRESIDTYKHEVIKTFTTKSGRKVSMMKSNNNRHFRTVHGMIVDGIPYDCDITQISEYSGKSNSGSLANTLIVLHADTGQVDLSVNRETVNYTQTTIDFINDVFADLHSDMKDEINELLDSASGYYEACVIANAISLDKLGFISSAMKTLEDAGKNVAFSISWVRHYVSRDVVTSYKYKGRDLSVHSPRLKALRFQLAYLNDNGNVSYKNIDNFDMMYFYSRKVFILDTKTKSMERTRRIIAQNSNRHEFILVSQRPFEINKNSIIPIARQTEIHAEELAKQQIIFDSMEIPTQKYSSVSISITKSPNNTPVVKSDIVTVNVRQLENSVSSRVSENFRAKQIRVKRNSGPVSSSDIGLQHMTLYVPVKDMNNFHESVGNEKIKIMHYMRIVYGLTVYAVPERMAHHFKDCLDLGAALLGVSHRKVIQIERAMYANEISKSIQSSGILNIDFNNQRLLKDMRILIHQASRRRKTKQILRMNEHIIAAMIAELKLKPIHPEFYEIETYMRDFHVRYPLSKHVGLTYISTEQKQYLALYIKLMDEHYKSLEALKLLSGV